MGGTEVAEDAPDGTQVTRDLPRPGVWLISVGVAIFGVAILLSLPTFTMRNVSPWEKGAWIPGAVCAFVASVGLWFRWWSVRCLLMAGSALVGLPVALGGGALALYAPWCGLPVAAVGVALSAVSLYLRLRGVAFAAGIRRSDRFPYAGWYALGTVAVASVAIAFAFHWDAPLDMSYQKTLPPLSTDVPPAYQDLIEFARAHEDLLERMEEDHGLDDASVDPRYSHDTPVAPAALNPEQHAAVSAYLACYGELSVGIDRLLASAQIEERDAFVLSPEDHELLRRIAWADDRLTTCRRRLAEDEGQLDEALGLVIRQFSLECRLLMAACDDHRSDPLSLVEPLGHQHQMMSFAECEGVSAEALHGALAALDTYSARDVARLQLRLEAARAAECVPYESAYYIYGLGMFPIPDVIPLQILSKPNASANMLRARLCQLSRVEANGWQDFGGDSFRDLIDSIPWVRPHFQPLCSAPAFLPSLGDVSFGDAVGSGLSLWDRTCNPLGVLTAATLCLHSPAPEYYFWAQAYTSRTRAAVALRLYLLDRGELPAALDDLCPDYLDAVPLDPFVRDAPIIYRRVPGGATLTCRRSALGNLASDMAVELQFPELAGEVGP